MTRLRSYQTLLVCILLAPTIYAQSDSAKPEPKPVNAMKGILNAFDNHPIVAIAENHWLRQAGDFYEALIQDPAFAAKVNDIVVEFGSRRSQQVADRYVSGGDVSQPDLQRIWRDSTKVMSWESPIYSELLAAVRQVNRKGSKTRQLRVLLGDSSIDWSKINTNAEWSAFQPNDNSFSSVIVTEVLERHRKALVILGGNHLTKDGNRDGESDATTLVEQEFPGSMYVALMYSQALPLGEGEVPNWPAPSLLRTDGTTIGAISMDGRTLRDMADALLYLGPKESLTMAAPDWDALRRDSAYMQEVGRRYQIVYGCKFDQSLLGKGRPCQ